MKKLYILLISALCLIPLAAKKIAPPVAETREQYIVAHGDSLYDGYHWLQEREDAALWQLFEAEARYYKDQLKSTRALGTKLYKTHRTRLRENLSTFPYHKGDYEYYSRRKPKQLYYAHYRKKAGGKEELILDENRLAKGKSYFDLGDYALSECGGYLAYTVDYQGDENYRLYIKNLTNGKTQDTELDNVSEAMWITDAKALLYTTDNEHFQTDRAWYLDLTKLQPQLLHHETEPAKNLGLYKSSDKSRIFMSVSSRDANEVYQAPADQNPPEFKLFAARQAGHRYWPDFYGGKYIIESNLKRSDREIYQCAPESTATRHWQPLVSDENLVISSAYPVQDKLILFCRQEGFEKISVHELESGAKLYQIKADAPTDYGFWHHEEGKDYFYYSREQELEPYSIYKHELKNRADTKVYQSKAPKGYNKEDYLSTLLFATAADGTKIPIRLKYRRDLDLNRPQALFLSAYGAYGSSEDPYFSYADLILMDEGLIIGTAHPRGGGEYGHFWHEEGKLLNKMNTFTDFTRCAEYLIDNGYTSSSKLAIYGGSAGGLLIGAVLNHNPELFGAAWLDVPFVDALNTMLDDSLPLTTQEYEEWGNPEDYEHYAYIKSYSPVNNIAKKDYPPVLISAGLNDVRVGYWEGLKYAQLLRSASNQPVLFLLNREGHAGSSNRFFSLKEYYRNLAWILSQIKDND